MRSNHGRRFSAISAVVCATALAAPAAVSAHGDNGLGSHEYGFDLAPVPHDATAETSSVPASSRSRAVR